MSDETGKYPRHVSECFTKEMPADITAWIDGEVDRYRALLEEGARRFMAYREIRHMGVPRVHAAELVGTTHTTTERWARRAEKLGWKR